MDMCPNGSMKNPNDCSCCPGDSFWDGFGCVVIETWEEFECWNGEIVTDKSLCTEKVICWNEKVVTDES